MASLGSIKQNLKKNSGRIKIDAVKRNIIKYSLAIKKFIKKIHIYLLKISRKEFGKIAVYLQKLLQYFGSISKKYELGSKFYHTYNSIYSKIKKIT